VKPKIWGRNAALLKLSTWQHSPIVSRWKLPTTHKTHGQRRLPVLCHFIDRATQHLWDVISMSDFASQWGCNGHHATVPALKLDPILWKTKKVKAQFQFQVLWEKWDGILCKYIGPAAISKRC
jgi:hypothetical protein